MDNFTSELLDNSWERSWNLIFIDHNNRLKENLIWRYSDPSRKYHNISHLIGSILTLKKFRYLADYPEMIELALWFHDAIYDTSKNDNEFKSAMLWMNSIFLPNGNKNLVKEFYHIKFKKIGFINSISHLIMATSLSSNYKENDQKLIRDIDLITLGADDITFQKYCEKIRKEYWYIPSKKYWTERYNILDNIYKREHIYEFVDIIVEFEAQAKYNIKKELSRIKYILENI